MRPDVKPEFMAYWRETVQPLAMKCARDFSTMKAVEDRGEATPAELEIINQYHDPLAAWYIGLMAGDINSAALYGQSLNMINSVSQVHGTLAKESTYWADVWAEKTDTEEYRDLRALGEVMPTLLRKI